MIRITLIVTGMAEHRGLHLSLERVCRAVLPHVPVEFLDPQYVDSFTSGMQGVGQPLPPGQDTPDPPARKLANAVIGALTGGRRKNERADFAFAIDDLEVPNLPDPAAVVRYFGTHVERALGACFGPSRSDQNRRKWVCEHASFHLLAPMLESHFFVAPDVLKAAGSQRDSRFDPVRRDWEDFLVEDPDYDIAPRGPRAGPLGWYQKHPKKYLKFLSADTYRETRHGKAALDVLDWRAVLGAPLFGDSGCFARSLLDDVLEALEPAAGQKLVGRRHPLTEYRPGRFLRNIDAPSQLASTP